VFRKVVCFKALQSDGEAVLIAIETPMIQDEVSHHLDLKNGKQQQASELNLLK